MSEHGILKYSHPILDKKDPPEDKELPDPSEPLPKVIPLPSIASCNAEVTKVLKQAKCSVTKSYYMKLTPAIVGSPHPYKCGNHAQLWSAKMNTFLNPCNHMIIPQC